MKKIFTLALSMLTATVAGSAFAENPYAPTGNETVIGQTQVLYHPTKDKANILKDAAQLGEGADGWQVQCMNTAKNLEQAGKITVGDQQYASIKISNGNQTKVTLPAGCVANAVTIYSSINKEAATTRPCYWKEVDGTINPAPETDQLTSFKNFTTPDVSYFTLKGNNFFTLTNSGEQPLAVLVVDYSKLTFGEATLAAPAVWPLDKSGMLPLDGEFILTFDAEVKAAGQADLNGTALDMIAEGATVKIPYSGLTASTEYTLTIPAGVIGNDAAANEALTYTFTSAVANTLYYTDFHVYPYAFYEKYGNITENTNIIAKNSTDVTAEVAGITYYSGVKGRVVLLNGSVNSPEIGADYGPETAEDLGASNRANQIIGGGKTLYAEFPETDGPVEVTLFIGNGGAKAGTIVLTDELGNTAEPLASFELPAAKCMKKFTYSYPYKGKTRLRLYNMGVQINVNDILIVKGEGEGIDKPVVTDDEAPVLAYSWPSVAPYAPVEGNIVLGYNENIVAATKAVVNGVETEITVDGKVATIAYAGLENGKTYTAQIPAVADEAGNATEPFELTFTTVAADVIYYTDFAAFPFTYWEKHHGIPNEAGDNNDIIAKNSTDVTAECGGITYYSGTNGRVVAMGKPNLLGETEEDYLGASARCIQISGGEGALYAELAKMEGPCEITLWIGNSTEKEFSFELRNALVADAPALATFTTEAVKKMFKFSYKFNEEAPVQFRLYNMANQFNVHDILVVKAEKETPSGITEIEASEEVPAVYYNLQGVRVENPANGLYIRVRGNIVDKVLVK